MVGESNRGRNVLIAVVATAVFMANLDLWIVNVALVDIGRDLGGSLSSVSWVLDAYAVTLAALLVPAGRLGDRLGHRLLFLIGTAVFTLASLACAAAPDVGLLVVARVVQAAGAAAQLPTSLALLMGAVEPARRLAAARGWAAGAGAAAPAGGGGGGAGVVLAAGAAAQLPTSLALLMGAVEPARRLAAARGWAAVGALAAVAGPVLGGVLVSASWRWVFLVNLPVGVVAFVAGLRVLPRHERRSTDPLPDPIATALLIVAVASVTGALVEAPTWGWLDVRTIVLAVVAVVAAWWFTHRCRTQPNPMIELALVRVRRFTLASSATFVFSAAFAIMLLSNSLWCQEVWRYSPLRTGLAMVPGPAMVPLVTFASARLVQRVGAGPVAAIGAVVFAISQGWRIVFAHIAPDYVRDLLPSMVIGGIGVGLTLGTLIATGATALPPARAATGSAIINSVRQIASALGVAVLVTVLASHASVNGYRISWVIGAALAIVTAAVSVRFPHTTPAPATAAAGSAPAVPVKG